MARLCPGAFPGCRPWQDCAPMRSRRGLGREKHRFAAIYRRHVFRYSLFWQDMRAMHPKSPAKRRWGMHRANILPPRGVFAVRSPQIMHGARILPPSDGLAPAQGLLPEQPHRGIAFQRLGPCAGMPAPALRRCPPPANACHSLHPSQSETSRRWTSVATIRRMACSSAKPRGTADCIISTGRPITECCAELGLNSRTVSKWAQSRRRRPQARPVLRQRCRKRPSKGRIPLGGTIGTPHPFPIAQKKPTPGINPRVSFICVLSCIQPVRVSSCFTLGSFSAGCRPFFRLAPAAQQRFGASKLAVASLQGTTFRQSASPARRLTLATRYWTSAFHRPCKLQYSYTATGSSPGTTAKSALGSSPG